MKWERRGGDFHRLPSLPPSSLCFALAPTLAQAIIAIAGILRKVLQTVSSNSKFPAYFVGNNFEESRRPG